MSEIPNWASNALQVTNGERFFAELRTHMSEGDVIENLFAAFLPMPDELRGIITGSAQTADGTRVNRWRVVGEDKKIVEVSMEERDHLRSVYGADNWYDWSVARYGTKWDTDATFDGDRLNFDTAWSPPSVFVQSLSLMFPEATFTLAFCEGGMNFWGQESYRNGEQIDSVGSNHVYLDDVDWEDDARDDDPYFGVTPSCRDHLERWGLHTGG